FARSLGCTLDLLTVFVGAGQEPGVITQHAVPPSDRVAGNRGVGVSDVRTRIDVVDRGRDVKLFTHDFGCAAANVETRLAASPETGQAPSLRAEELAASLKGYLIRNSVHAFRSPRRYC